MLLIATLFSQTVMRRSVVGALAQDPVVPERPRGRPSESAEMNGAARHTG